MMNKFGQELEKFLDFKNISIKEFAERIDTTPKNLIDILKGKIELSQNMIYNISFVTEIPVSYIENVEKSYRLRRTIDLFLDANNITIRHFINKFNYKELSEKYNIKYTNIRNDYSIAEDIFKYLRITNPNQLYKTDNSIFYKSKNNHPELLALWLERCYRIVIEQEIGIYNKNNIEKIIVEIKKMASSDIFDEEQLIKLFNKNGIYLAIEDDLSTSKIRGAFRVLGDKPAIYITRKHKRYADIYFALLHELAHCKSDYNRAKKGSIISNYDDIEMEEYEKKADSQALNFMIDDQTYNKLKENYNEIEKFDIVKSFFVYRLAKDGIIKYNSEMYQKYNKTII